MIYIVPACHFVNNGQGLCRTTYTRLQKALELYKAGDRILVTGDVPYSPGEPTLGELMQTSLLQAGGIYKAEIFVLKGGVGTFSEARLACEFLKHTPEITVISSPWYFWQGELIWSQRAKEKGIKINFLPVMTPGGLRTKLTYGLIAATVYTATLLGLEEVLEKIMTASQQSRRQGFKLNGCA